MLVNKYYLTTDLRIPRTIKIKNKVTGEIEERETGGNFRVGILYIGADGMTHRRFTALIVTPPKTRLIETWLRCLDAIDKRTQLNPELVNKFLTYRKTSLIFLKPFDTLLEAKFSGAHLYGAMINNGIIRRDEINSNELLTEFEKELIKTSEVLAKESLLKEEGINK